MVMIDRPGSDYRTRGFFFYFSGHRFAISAGLAVCQCHVATHRRGNDPSACTCGVFVLQQKRGIKFLDSKISRTSGERQLREGLIAVNNPRHLVVDGR